MSDVADAEKGPPTIHAGPPDVTGQERNLVDVFEDALIEYDEEGRVFGESGAGAFFLAKFLADKVEAWCADGSVVALCAEYAGEEPTDVADVLSQLIYALPDGVYTRVTPSGADQ